MWASSNFDSPAYYTLVTNSSKATTHLSPVALPHDIPTFLPRASAERYLEHFAHHYNLQDNIHFSTTVQQVTRWSNDNTWSVTMKHLTTGRITTSVYRAVIVAVGTQSRSTAYTPADMQQQALEAGIPSIHSCDYREPSAYAGKSVLIVGFGNSAAEIAVEVSRGAKRTLMAVRSTPWMVPLNIFGVPADVIGAMPAGPHWLQMAMFTVLQRLYVGHPTKLGFPQPPNHRLLDRLPVVERGIAQALRSGRVQLRPNVAHITSSGVSFEGSTAAEAEEIDAIIFATGYRRQYPYLPEGCRTDDELPDLVLTVFHPTETGLIFMPEFSVPQAGWPMYSSQAEAIVQYLSADAEQSRRCVEFSGMWKKRYASPDYKGHLFCAADRWHADPVMYSRMMADFAQWISAKGEGK